MKRPPIVLWLLLVAMWLMLNGTLAFSQFVLGGVLALGVMLFVRRMRPLQPQIRRPWVALRLALVVLKDIVRSNIAVARVILGMSGSRQITSGFLEIPLAMRDPHGLAALAMIITATPGTVWAGFVADTGTLTLHVLDLKDREYWIQLIKRRYERPLMEIFE